MCFVRMLLMRTPRWCRWQQLPQIVGAGDSDVLNNLIRNNFCRYMMLSVRNNFCCYIILKLLDMLNDKHTTCNLSEIIDCLCMWCAIGDSITIIR